ncbi:zinc finger protein 236-like isoform X2 [Varroa destructor]|uniref:C2H2-type domain-containing protein n=1 Tax=Varroa destructor TaxID=109461 RepID=A0A7M7JEL9_VARDE|nr:zinc finger protein 236-like isoform X2 [Varroa destructor]
MASAESPAEVEADGLAAATLQGGTAVTHSGAGVYLNVLNADGSVGTLFLDTSQLNIQQREEGFFEITTALVAASPETNTSRAPGRKDDATPVVFGAARSGVAIAGGTPATGTGDIATSVADATVHSSTAGESASVSANGGGDTSSIRFITAGHLETLSSRNADAVGNDADSSNIVHINTLNQTIDISEERSQELSETFRCTICSLEFSSECRLQLHLKSHFCEKPHKCDSCEQAFNHEVNLILHRAAAHPTADSTLSCPVCHKRFLRQASLKSHASVHLKDEFFVCTHCEVECDTQEELNYHVQMLHSVRDSGEISGLRGPRLMRCFTCRKSFTNKEEFAAHRLHHQKMKSALRSNRKAGGGRGSTTSKKESNENKAKGRLGRANRPMHECPTCSKAFSKASLLARHATIHTGEKKYSCKVCGRRFTQEVTVRAHMAVHTGERPFECPFCEVRFSQKSNLRAHVARLHPMGKPERKLECPVCPCVFGTSTALGCHISKRHQQIATTANTSGINSGEPATPVQRAVLIQCDNGQGKNTENIENNQLRVVKKGEDSSETGNNEQEETETAEDKTRDGHSTTNSGLREGEEGEVEEVVETGDCEGPPKHSEREKVQTSPSAAGSYDNKQQKDQDECQIRLAPLTDAHTGEVWEHVVRRAGGRAFHQCMFCSREFRRPSDLVRHIRMHTQSRPFKCHECLRTFSLKSSLSAHMRIHGDSSKAAAGTASVPTEVGGFEEGRTVQCPFCPRSFRSEQGCKTHMAVHGVAAAKIYTQYRCRQCETLVFESKDMLAVHVQEAHGELLVESTELLPMQEPIMISETDGVSSTAVEAGVTSTEGRRPFSCDICGYKFKKSSHLKQHLRSHTGEKPFRCGECLKSFTSRSILKAHIRTHSGLKEFHCPKCSASFTTRGSLRRHQESHKESSATAEGEEEPEENGLGQRTGGRENTGSECSFAESTVGKDSRAYVCPYCEKRFRNNGAARKHIAASHSTESTIHVFREGALRDRIIQEGGQENEHDAGIEESAAALDIQGDPQAKQQILQASQSSPMVSETSGTVQQSTGSTQIRRGCDSVVQLHIIADPDNPPTHQVPGKELFGLSALGPSGTLIQLVSRGDDGTQVLTDASGSTIVRTMTGDLAALDQLPLVSSSASGSPGGTRLTLAGVTDTGLPAESFTIPSEGIDVSTLASQLGTTEETITLLLQQNNVIDNNVHTSRTTDHDDSNDYHQYHGSNEQRQSGGDQLSQEEGNPGNPSNKIEDCRPQDDLHQEVLITDKDVPSIDNDVPTENAQTSNGIPTASDGIINYRCSGCGKIFDSSRHLVAHLRCCQGDISSGELAEGQSPDTMIDEPAFTVLTCLNCGAEANDESALRDHVKKEHGVAALRNLARQLAREKARPKGSRGRSNRESGARSASGNTAVAEGIQLIQIEATEELAKKNPRETTSLFERALIASANDVKRTHLLGEESRRSSAMIVPGQHLHRCSDCGRGFKKNSDLIRHMRTHTGERPYSCSICGKAFTVKSSLDVHTRTHSGLRQYPCEVCSRGFATMGSLIVHMRLHTGARPFACSFCPARFRTSGHRKMHLRQHLSSDNPSLKTQRISPQENTSPVPNAAPQVGVGSTTVQLQMTTTDGGSFMAAENATDSGRRFIAINPDSNEEYELLELEELLAANPALAEQLQQQGTLSLALNAAPGEQEMMFERDQSVNSNPTAGAFIESSVTMPSVVLLQCSQPNCSAAFTKDSMLQRHLVTKHGAKKQAPLTAAATLVRYKCGVCNQSFGTQQETVDHMRNEHGVLAATETQAE